jgi:hypothetical protein
MILDEGLTQNGCGGARGFWKGRGARLRALNRPWVACYSVGRSLFGAEGGEVSTGGRLLAVMTKVPPDSVAPQPVLAAR